MTLATPAGPLGLTADGAGLVRVRWLPADSLIGPDFGVTPLLDRARVAVRTYLADPARPRPPVPLGKVAATVFQRRVWRLMLAIPSGAVRTYGDLARDLGTSPRAVGAAARANPWPVLVPCHRVMARGDLGGYGGPDPEARAIKRWLLEHEGASLPEGAA
mgnify:CR=1 FL=1